MVEWGRKGDDRMIFNGVTEYLERRFLQMREEYFRQCQLAEDGRRGLSVRRFFYDEMAFKLLFLVDREFETFQAYLDGVRELVPLRKSYLVQNLKDPEKLAALKEAERECLAFLNGVRETDTAEPENYCRVIVGAERDRLEYAILEKWGYCVDYWYPLKGEFDESKLFLNVQYLESYWDQLCALLGLPGERLYEYGESSFDDGNLSEVDAITEYGGYEAAYLPRDLGWIVYFSHEETVTFAGGILPAVKELLKSEREHWNKWE